jgi:PAS domain S-box-containing protein
MDSSFQVLWEDNDRIFCRASRQGSDGGRKIVLAVLPAEHASSTSLDRVAHEYALKDQLDSAWAIRPLELERDRGRPVLLLEDPGGEPLERLLGTPMEIGRFLPLAIGIATALSRVHQRGLVHKDLKPAHILVNCEDGRIRFTGFGIASRLARERRTPGPPEFIVGTLPYMAPEQTGWMNRSIDSRCDLYSLGVTLYQMLTGSLPFTAASPMEWVHSHIARKPVPPSDRVNALPIVVSAIVLKLLDKSAEQRYQSAAGLEHDLGRCVSEWETTGRIEEFALGQHDTPDRLLIPEKLYGRESEIETLLAAFDDVIKSGAPELVLVSGYSGIGKSSVVNELHRMLVPSRGFFASGKFDQYKRDIPYATLAQAFQDLIRPLLGKSEADLAPWRAALCEALRPNAQLMVDIVPELKLIIGDQPSVPELPPQDAQRRFQLLFRRFIGVFARPEHPLALFLDDLQWLDAATLELLEDLLTRSDVAHLLLIGAYRDNEVDVAHPLRRKLDAIRTAGGKVVEITLAPLAREHLGQLIADALRCGPEQAAPLARLMHGKTGGNPFFAIQFFSALAEERMLSFDYDTGRWSWDIKYIHAQAYTDNVVDLVVGKLARLPAETQAALQQLACLGNSAEITTISIVLEIPEERVDVTLWPAVRQELVEHLSGAYRFVHDRVQEAAYSLIPEQQRVEAHLRIGRMLLAHTPPEKQDEVIFDIVNHFNRGAALITSQDERERLAGLNLIASRRAKASTAYTSALNYLAAGSALLPADCWEHQHQLVFSLQLHWAECEFVTGAVAQAEQRLSALAERSANASEQGSVARLQVDLYMALSQRDRAISVGLGYLQRLGICWSVHPGEDDVRRQYEKVWSRIGRREIEDLLDLPLMTDAVALATLDLLTALMPPAFYTDANLRSLVVLKAVELSLEWGHSEASCEPYVVFGAMVGALFGDYQTGLRFSNIGIKLVERRGLSRVQAPTYLSYGNLVLPWTKHLRHARDAYRRAFETANGSDEMTAAAFSCSSLNANFLAAGDPLPEAQREAEHGLRFAEKANFALLVDIMKPQIGLIRMLRGLTQRFGAFDDGQFDEAAFERHLAADPAFELPESWYWIRKLQARCFSGDYASAVDAASKARRLRWAPPQLFETAEYEFYAALSHAACWDSAPTDQRQQHRLALSAHHSQLETWARNCPENFADRAALVGAEIARLEGRNLDAERLYETAIHSARESGFIHNEAIAYELASRFYAARGFEEFARLYLRNARDNYARWGADGKVRQLESTFPHLRTERPEPGSVGTIGAPVEHLDLATVIKVSEAVSGEMVLEKLIDTLMRTAIEQAGAERGLLILSHGTEPRIEAEATTSGDRVMVQLREVLVTAAELPQSVLHYVLRTRECAILDDAAVQSPFATDPYVNQSQARSILCLPLINHAKLVGALYLENTLAPHVFAPARIAVLKLLASQAAIALENARLYRDVSEREAKIRRLVDANIIGITIWELGGQILEANDAFLRIVGYDREDLVSGRLRWTDLTPPEWLDRQERLWIPQLKMMGTVQPFEQEYFRKGGSRVPVLIGMAFDEQREQGVSFVVDLTERKRSEEALRESEERFRTLVQFSFDVYWESDAQHRFIRQEFAEVLADALASRSEIGKTRWEVPYLEPDAEAWRKHRETLDAHLPFRDFELARPTRDGGKRYVSVSGLPAFDKAGHFIGYRGASRDITERKRAVETLREVQRELAHANRLATMGELTASIAHEVSQPIAGASMNADAALHFLHRNPPDLENVGEALGLVVKDTDRASGIIGRIRDLVKKASPQKDRLDINEAIRDVIELTRSEALKNGVSVQTELAKNLPFVEGDRVQLQQVVLNLIVNAIQAMGPVAAGTRQVLITTARAEPHGVLVEVKDSGPGVVADRRERVFDPFYTTKPAGLGVGLSICRSTIEAHGGRLWVTANAPHGAIFHFTVPTHPGSAS